jgi:serine/threonine-protein kinase RsbW
MGAGIRGQPLIAPEWKELRVKADLAEIERVRGFLRQMMHGIIIAEEETMKLELALHEIFVNVVMHAYPNGDGAMTIRIRSDEGTFCIEIRDRGIPFNPDEIPPIDLDKKIQLGTSGGLGIYLFKTLMDEYSYKRDGDENVLTICKRIR